MTLTQADADDDVFELLSKIGSASVQQRVGEIFRLWDELHDFGKDQTDAALEYSLKRICAMLDAQDGFWVGVVHIHGDAPQKRLSDPMFGWRIRSIRPLHAQHHDTKHYRKVVKDGMPAEIGTATTGAALAAGGGRFRAYTLQSGRLVDMEAFQQTAYYDFYFRRLDTRDRIWVVVPVNADTESCFCFDRKGEKPNFSDEDLELAAFALRGIKWFHRQLMLSHGLGLCEEPLTSSECRVIQHLLSGASESEIAQAMRLSQGTVHQYAVRIYQKFAVRGRVEFIALWLSGKPAAKAAAPDYPGADSAS